MQNYSLRCWTQQAICPWLFKVYRWGRTGFCAGETIAGWSGYGSASGSVREPITPVESRTSSSQPWIWACCSGLLLLVFGRAAFVTEYLIFSHACIRVDDEPVMLPRVSCDWCRTVTLRDWKSVSDYNDRWNVRFYSELVGLSDVSKSGYEPPVCPQREEADYPVIFTWWRSSHCLLVHSHSRGWYLSQVPYLLA
jgi:hypothetical protein